MKSVLVYASILLLGGLFLKCSSIPGAIYCVRSASSANATVACSDRDCQQCETLQYYFDNVDSINQQERITMLFMTGIHKVHIKSIVTITPPVMNILGKDNVKVMATNNTDNDAVYFNNTSFSIENLTMINWPDVWIFGANSVLKDCTFIRDRGIAMINGSTVSIKNCIFQNIGYRSIVIANIPNVVLEDFHVQSSFVDVDNSTVSIGGDSEFITCTYDMAVLSKSSTITLLGNVLFANNSGTNGGALFMHSSSLIIEVDVNVTFINNKALYRGGAMYLSSSTFYISAGANVTFIHNSAVDKGGAIYVEPGITPAVVSASKLCYECLYHIFNCYNNSTTMLLLFANNTAANGGNDVYGVSLKECSTNCSTISSSISSVSSDPLRICVCDHYGVPQCNKPEFIYMSQKIYPGEIFTVPAVIVGWDFGATIGIVYANLTTMNSVMLNSNIHVVTDDHQCTNLTFSLLSGLTNENVTIYITGIHMDTQLVLDYAPSGYCSARYPAKSEGYHYCIHTTPVFVNLTLLPCPLGFNLTNQQCDCYLHHVLFDNCALVNSKGYFSWSTNAWVNVQKNGVVYNLYCPFDYCKTIKENIRLQDDSDSQCAFHRAGRLCGGCRENYSLAIGSSHCIHCPNNNNLALLIFFAAAGFLLVFFISAFNLTVAQGMINGLIFYANIVWGYRSIEVNQNGSYFSIFLAWLNLDFGIESCFFSGLNAFWKASLQYVFPFYTAGLFIIGLTYSSNLAKLFGDRSVPTLATLLFLSYAKLLRTIIISLELAPLTSYPDNSTIYVWFIDGQNDYGKFPHIILLVAALVCLLLLWLPFTLLLLLMQWLRQQSNQRIANWITRYKPITDAYFAPLKDKHHYWFGVLLIVRGILLLTSALTSNINPAISLFLLLGLSLLLLWYINYKKVYKEKSVLILESCFLFNLILLVCGILYTDSKRDKVILVNISVGFVVFKFCVIVFWNLVCFCRQKLTSTTASDSHIQQENKITNTVVTEERNKDDNLRDSILENTPLLINTEGANTY